MAEAIRPADRSDAADRPLRGKLTTPTRRDFIRGIAAAGASTAGAVAMQRSGLDLFSEQALARGGRNAFSDFTRHRRFERRRVRGSARLPRRRPDLVGRHSSVTAAGGDCATASTTTSSRTSL